MTDNSNEIDGARETAPSRSRFPRSLALVAALVAAGAVGAGATALTQRGHTVTYVALAPAQIAAMHDRSQVALQGDVAETFGNKFVMQDGSGKALVETGRSGEGRDLVVKDEKVVVQGRFENGFVHAISIRHADGRTDALNPPPHPRPDAPAADRPDPL